MKGYKGFDKNLQCRDLQYKVGETIEEKEAKLCSKGLHFCENPLDVFAYYPPSTGRFCEVEADDVTDEVKNDSKRVAKKLHIKAEIGLGGVIQAGVKITLEKAEFADKNKATGVHSGASATGVHSGASATGDYSGASATGDYSGASATGDYSGASATGNCSGASATGYKSGASAGRGSVALAIGMLSRAKGDLGAFIVLTECKKTAGDYFIKDVQCAKVDGEKIKADTWYTLKDGEFVIVDDKNY